MIEEKKLMLLQAVLRNKLYFLEAGEVSNLILKSGATAPEQEAQEGAQQAEGQQQQDASAASVAYQQIDKSLTDLINILNGITGSLQATEQFLVYMGNAVNGALDKALKESLAGNQEEIDLLIKKYSQQQTSKNRLTPGSSGVMQRGADAARLTKWVAKIIANKNKFKAVGVSLKQSFKSLFKSKCPECLKPGPVTQEKVKALRAELNYVLNNNAAIPDSVKKIVGSLIEKVINVKPLPENI